MIKYCGIILSRFEMTDSQRNSMLISPAGRFFYERYPREKRPPLTSLTVLGNQAIGVSGRKTQEKTEFRTMILDAAWSLVLKDGWPALSLRNISESIHYSVPVIYDHFENKEAILLEFSRQGFGLLRKKLFTAGHKCRDPREQLQAIAIAYWTFAFRNPAYYQLMFGLGMPSSDMEKCREERNALRNLVVAPIQSILKAHGKNEVIAGVKYHTYWSVLHGLVAMKMLGCKGSSKTPDKLIVVDAISGFVRNLEQ